MNAEKVARAIVAVWGSGSGHADLEKSITRALLTAHEAGRREGIEEAAQITEENVTNAQTHQFVCEGRYMKTVDGQDTFITTLEASNILRRKAAAIRALSERPK